MAGLRDYRIETRSELEGYLVKLYEGSKVKDHYLLPTFDAAKGAVNRWLKGQKN